MGIEWFFIFCFSLISAWWVVISSHLSISRTVFHSSFGAPLVAQTIKNLPATQEAWVWSLGQEVSLEKKMATPLQYICLEIPIDREAGPRGLQRVGQDWVTKHTCASFYCIVKMAGSLSMSITSWLILNNLISMICFHFIKFSSLLLPSFCLV